VGNVASSLAVPVTFSVGDRELQVSPWVLEIQALFERYLEKEVLDGFHRTQHLMDPDQADKVAAKLASDVGLGKYTFGTEAVGEALRSKKHLSYLFFLSVKKNHPDVQLSHVAQWASDRDTWDRMVQAMNLANFDPKGKTPGEKEGAPGPSPA